METPFIFHQLFESESSTFTYMLGDRNTGEAILIDPVRETVERDLKLVSELGLRLKYVFDTHVHADHVTGAGKIRELTRARTGIGARARVECVDHRLREGETFRYGGYELRVLETPGHTNGCLTFLSEGMAFTGDALMIRAAGRTDFQEGSAGTLFDSITRKLFTLPAETKVYPAHDYKGQTSSTIEMERKFNARLTDQTRREEFIAVMSGLNLPPPKKIHIAVPANVACGQEASGS